MGSAELDMTGEVQEESYISKPPPLRGAEVRGRGRDLEPSAERAM